MRRTFFAVSACMLSGCFLGSDRGSSSASDPGSAIPLHSLDFAYKRGILSVDTAGVQARFEEAGDALTFRADIQLMAYQPGQGTPTRPRWSFPSAAGRIHIPLDTLTVEPGLLAPAGMPGFSLSPPEALFIRVGTFGDSPILDTAESVSYGLYDTKSSSHFAIYHVDRPAELTVDTALCGRKLQKTIRFPQRGFYALAFASGLDAPDLAPLVPGADPIYFAAMTGFIYRLSLRARAKCRDPAEDKAPLLGKWRSTASDTSSGIRYLEFREDDTLLRLDQQAEGARRAHRLPYFTDGAKVFHDGNGNGFAYQLSSGEDTLRVDGGATLVRDESPGPLPEWIKPLKVSLRIDGDFEDIEGLSSEGSSLWVSRRGPDSVDRGMYTIYNHTVVRLDTTGRRLDSAVFRTGWGFSDPAGMGIAMEGDSILWIPSSWGAIRMRTATREQLPAFKPDAFYPGSHFLGFDEGRIWTLNSSSLIRSWKPDSTGIDSVPDAPTNWWRWMTVSKGSLLYASSSRILVKGLGDKRWLATYEFSGEVGEIMGMSAREGSVWVLWRGSLRNGVAYSLLRFDAPGPDGRWAPR